MSLVWAPLSPEALAAGGRLRCPGPSRSLVLAARGDPLPPTDTAASSPGRPRGRAKPRLPLSRTREGEASARAPPTHTQELPPSSERGTQWTEASAPAKLRLSRVESRPVSPPLGEVRAPLGGRSSLRKGGRFGFGAGGRRRRSRTGVAGREGRTRPWGWKPLGMCVSLRLRGAWQVLGQVCLQPGPSDVSPGVVDHGRPGRAPVAVSSLSVLLPGRVQCWGTWASLEGHSFVTWRAEVTPVSQ